MKIEIDKCMVERDQIHVILKLDSTLEELKNEGSDSDSQYRYNRVKAECIQKIANVIAKEYLEKHKMDIINSLAQEEIVDGIKLKIIENFSINKRD